MNQSIKQALKTLQMEQVRQKAASEFVDTLLKDGRPKPSQLWELSDKVMLYFFNHKNPIVREDMRTLMRDAATRRQTLKNEHGSNESKTLRVVGYMPEQYLRALQAAYGGQLPIPYKDFKTKFFKRYPAFRVSKL